MCFALGSAIVVVVFSGLFAIAAAQEPAEELFENLGAETAVSPELDAVEMFSARPLDLRRATAAELAAIPGFSLSTARRILRLVKTIADISYDRIADSLRLSPEHLGPLEVRIDVRDGNVSVAFGVAHLDTQAALEQALPRLREMFAAAGLQLGQASVQQEARRGSHNGGQAPAGAAAAADNGAGAGPAGVRALGLVDDYA